MKIIVHRDIGLYHFLSGLVVAIVGLGGVAAFGLLPIWLGVTLGLAGCLQMWYSLAGDPYCVYPYPTLSLMLTKRQRLVEINTLIDDIRLKHEHLKDDNPEKERLASRMQELRAVGAAIEENRDRRSLDKLHQRTERILRKEIKGYGRKELN